MYIFVLTYRPFNPFLDRKALVKDRQYLPMLTNTRCHPGQDHYHLLCGEWLCWAPLDRMESALAWLCHPPRRSEWSVQPGLSWPWIQELPGIPFSSNKVFTFSGLCSSCQVFLNTLSFVLSHSGALQGLPEKPSSISILWEWKAALHLPLICHKCYSPVSASPSPLCLFPVTPWLWQP